MKAAVINRFGNEQVFEFIDIPKPEIKDHEILIQVKYGSINPIDYKQRKGNHKFILGAPFPIVLGYDVSGIVSKVGKNVKHFKAGDAVFGRLDRTYGGGLAAYAAASASAFTLKPESLHFDQAAALPMAASTALQALRDKAKLIKEKRILITGAAGGVGHFAVQIAKIMAAEVHAISHSSHRDFINKLAPDIWLDYTKTDILNKNDRYDVIFDAAGIYSYLKCKHLLTQKGIYITSLPRPKLILHKLFAQMHGKKVKTLLMKARGSDLEQLKKWIQEGKLKIYIQNEFALSDISKAHALIEEGHTEGKIVVKISE